MYARERASAGARTRLLASTLAASTRLTLINILHSHSSVSERIKSEICKVTVMRWFRGRARTSNEVTRSCRCFYYLCFFVCVGVVFSLCRLAPQTHHRKQQNHRTELVRSFFFLSVRVLRKGAMWLADNDCESMNETASFLCYCGFFWGI